MSDVRLLTRSFLLLGLVELAYFSAVGMAVHTLPLYVTGPVGSDEAGAGLAFGAFGVTALLCRPYVGRLSDSRGRILLMVAGATLAGVGMLLIPLTSSLEALVAIRLLQGVAEAAFFVASFALLADIAPPERMGEAISYNSLGLYLGLALGPPLGEALLSQWSYGVAWTGAAVLCAITVGLTLLIVEPPRDRSIVGHGKLIHRPGIPASLGFFSSLVAVGGFFTFASLHSAEVGMENTSLALLVYGLVVVFCRIAFARVPDRVPSLPLGAASLLMMATGLAVMALWLSPAGLMVGVVITAFGVSFSAPAFFSAIFATATPSERGAAAGTASAFIDLGLGFGPICLGLVARSNGIPAAFLTGAGFAVLGAAWVGWLSTRRATVAA